MHQRRQLAALHRHDVSRPGHGIPEDRDDEGDPGLAAFVRDASLVPRISPTPWFVIELLAKPPLAEVAAQTH